MIDWPANMPDMFKNTVVQGDMRELCAQIPDESVDLIITDPPYPAKFDYLWEPLAREAARVLKTGGSLITLCGHYQVPLVINTLSSHLRYWWLLSMKQPRGARLPGKWVSVRHKPALWYVKGHRRLVNFDCPMDAFMSGVEDSTDAKKYHEWGQSAAWFEHYISALTLPEDVVLDPFVGGGTVAAVCQGLRRKWIAFELDPVSAEIARQRVSNQTIVFGKVSPKQLRMFEGAA